MRRPDTTLDYPPPDETFVWLVDAATPDVSSSKIRRHVAEGRSIDGFVPPSVATYIERHRLYRDHGTDSALHD